MLNNIANNECRGIISGYQGFATYENVPYPYFDSGCGKSIA